MNRFSAYYNWCPPGFVVPATLKSNITSLTSPAALFHINIPFNEQFSGKLRKPLGEIQISTDAYIG